MDERGGTEKDQVSLTIPVVLVSLTRVIDSRSCSSGTASCFCFVDVMVLTCVD